MSIDLRNFVNIDIQPSIKTYTNGTRETIALITSENIGEDIIVNNDENDTNYYADVISSDYPNTLAYLTMYFKNGGIKALVKYYDSTDETGTYTNLTALIDNLPNEYIVVGFVNTDGAVNYNIIKQVAENRNSNTSIYGINEKILLARDYATINSLDEELVKNFAVKYSNVIGAEMTIGAYLSQFDAYGINTVKDYMFTLETLTTEDSLSDTQYKDLIDNNYNVNIKLQGNSRDCGGNDKDGDSIINNFVRIVLHQTLTDVLIGLLTTKIKGVEGVSKIYATIVEELTHYINNGYLTSGKVWNKPTLKIGDYTIIEKGTPLVNGYYIKILPFSSLTDTQKKNGECPAIYIVLADQYSIRVINISGEVI